MTATSQLHAKQAQAQVEGQIREEIFDCRAGAAEFSVSGSIVGRGASANPYDLLCASLAACTTLAIQTQARRSRIKLTSVAVGVSFHHGGDKGRDLFERTIRFSENLDILETQELLQIAELCPVSRTLTLTADIKTKLLPLESPRESPGEDVAVASYAVDLERTSIVDNDAD